MITGSKSGKIFKWEITKENNLYQFKIIKKYKGHIGGVSSLALSQKTHKYLVSVGEKGFLKLWNFDKNSC